MLLLLLDLARLSLVLLAMVIINWPRAETSVWLLWKPFSLLN